jgi:hypothetical protein
MSDFLGLRSHVERLALLREEVKQRREAIEAKRAAFDATIADDARNLEACKRAVEAAEADVRGLTLVAHETTGNAKPSAGVSVVITKDYTVDEAAGFAWAKTTGLCLVPESLDVKAVKKLATVQALPFVTVQEVPAVRIATDLTKALADAVEVAA